MPRRYNQANRVFTTPLVQPGGQYEIPDIEDLCTVGKRIRGCPFFGSRLNTKADVTFCPYNYLLDPLIRERLNIDLKGSIVIFDEAHNIEDTCRDAASSSLCSTGGQCLRVDKQQFEG